MQIRNHSQTPKLNIMGYSVCIKLRYVNDLLTASSIDDDSYKRKWMTFEKWGIQIYTTTLNTHTHTHKKMSQQHNNFKCNNCPDIQTTE